MIFILAPIVAIIWAIDGQINKLVRPIAIPLVAVGAYAIHHVHPWWSVLPLFLYGCLWLAHWEGRKEISSQTGKRIV